MKLSIRYSLVLLALLALVLPGCGKKDEVDTAPLQQSFEGAEPAVKTAVNEAVSAIKSGDYAGAGAALQKLAGQAKITPEQQQAIKDVLAGIQKKLTGAVENAAEGGKKAMDDMKKALPKP